MIGSGMQNVSTEIQSQTFDVIKENQMIYDRVNKKFNKKNITSL